MTQRSSLALLLNGDPTAVRDWPERWNGRRLACCALVIFVGSGMYGAAMGWWRAPLQAGFVAIKFPLIILLTTIGNALINALLAPLLGLNIHFRQSLLTVLMSFVVASAVLGAFSPLAAFVIWNAPPLGELAGAYHGTYAAIMLVHVAVIAFAGIIGNLRLFGLLRELAPRAAVAWRVVVAWLAVNLFLGSQLCWILRPFIGSPGLPVEFLRADALRGNFYESVWRSALRVAGFH